MITANTTNKTNPVPPRTANEVAHTANGSLYSTRHTTPAVKLQSPARTSHGAVKLAANPRLETEMMSECKIIPLELLRRLRRIRQHLAETPVYVLPAPTPPLASSGHKFQRWSDSLLELLEKIYQHYDVPFFEGPLLSQIARNRACAAGKAGIRRISRACYRLGADIDVDKRARHVLTAEMVDLKACCQRLDYLVRTGRACPLNRARIEKLVANIKMSLKSGDIAALQDRRDFSDSYVKFCELTLMGEDTAATIRDLRKLAKDELDSASYRLAEFKALRKQYEDGGRRALAVFMQKNAKAARRAGFEEGVGSAEESQQIYDELEKIDRGLAKIGEILKESKEFWEGVDRKLSPTPASQQMKDLPDGITTGSEELRLGRRAENIHIGLQTVSKAAQHCSKSKKMHKAGDKIVGDAANLTKNSTDVVQTQKSAEIHLRNPVCDRRSGRKALSPLKKGLGQLVTGYEKLSLRFTKYAEMIYLLVWFAGSIATDKLLNFIPNIHWSGLLLPESGVCIGAGERLFRATSDPRYILFPPLPHIQRSSRRLGRDRLGHHQPDVNAELTMHVTHPVDRILRAIRGVSLPAVLWFIDGNGRFLAPDLYINI
ncbi:hypothetical protein B0H13DRAFT_1916060 [Mycena leptocephala]|nr:hypothetical protein B0H13DRAFT_1916060 [Mycena leptocephala]